MTPKRDPELTSGEVDKANADLTEEARNMYLDSDLTRRTWDIESRGSVSLVMEAGALRTLKPEQVLPLSIISDTKSST